MTDHTEMQIPDDVMEAARQAWNGIRNNSMRDGQFFIARAILSERTRCQEKYDAQRNMGTWKF